MSEQEPKRDMIRLRGTTVHYRVPEDMFPHAAAQMVANGRAEWVERREPTLADKAREVVSSAKQKLQDRRNRAETAALKRNAETAAIVTPPAAGPTLIDTGAEDFGADIDFESASVPGL